MALPLAHAALGLGLTRSRDPRTWLWIFLLSFAPDLDFVLVWVLDLSRIAYHRTFSHSIFFALAAAGLWALLGRRRPGGIPPLLCFAVLLSHGLLDILCTADVLDHGVLLFWPLHDSRLGYPVLVPLYRLFGDSPFSLEGALRFTLVEALLAAPLFYTARALRAGGLGILGCLQKKGWEAVAKGLIRRGASATGRDARHRE